VVLEAEKKAWWELGTHVSSHPGEKSSRVTGVEERNKCYPDRLIASKPDFKGAGSRFPLGGVHH